MCRLELHVSTCLFKNTCIFAVQLYFTLGDYHFNITDNTLIRCWKQFGDVNDCMGVTLSIKFHDVVLGGGLRQQQSLPFKSLCHSGWSASVCMRQQRFDQLSLLSHQLFKTTRISSSFDMAWMLKLKNEVIIKICLCHAKLCDSWDRNEVILYFSSELGTIYCKVQSRDG